MKKIRTLSVLVCLMMMAAQVWAFTPSDVAGTAFETDVALLSSLGIVKAYEDDTFRPDDPVTRAEVCTVLSRFVTYDSDLSVWEAQNHFVDVEENHWAYRDVNLLAAAGLLSPADDMRFRPDDTITYAELAKLVVTVLGYGPQAALRGGYPAGFMAQASSLKLFSGVPQGADKVLRGPFATVIANALDTDILVQTGFGANAEFTSEEGRTLLSEHLGIETEKNAVVEATYITSLGGAVVKQGWVTIGGVEYAENKTAASDYFGQSVRVYYKEEPASGDRSIVYLRPEKKNEVVTIEDELIKSVEPGGMIEYFETKDSTRTTSLSLRTDFKFIYNGKLDDTYTRGDFQPRFGKLAAIDNNGDGLFDVVMVEDYRNMVVDTVNTEEGIISDKFGGQPLTIDPKDNGLIVEYQQDGKPSSLDNISDGNVLSLAESKTAGGKRYVKIIISTVAIDGKASEITGDSATIAGTEYKFSPLFTGEIGLGESATFYIDFSGRLAGYDTDPTTSALLYGYLINAVKDTGLGDGATLRVFTAAGDVADYALKDKLTYNGSKKRQALEVFGLLPKAAGGAISPTLIKYQLDADKRIIKLYTPVTGPTDDDDALTLDGDVPENSEDGKYSYSAHIFGYKYAVDEMTVMFDVPGDEESWHDESQYEIRKLSSFAGDEKYGFKAYDRNEAGWVGAAVFVQKKTVTKFGKNSPAMIVSKVMTGLNSEGETVTQVVGFTAGKEGTFTLPDAVTYKFGTGTQDNLEIPSSALRLRKGDYIRYITNAKNEITAVQKSIERGSSVPFASIAKPDGSGITPQVSFDLGKYNDGLYQLYFGTVEYKDGMLAKVKLKKSDGAGGWTEEFAVFNLGRGSFYEFDARKETVALANAGAILDARSGNGKSRVFIRTRGTELMDTIIMKNLDEPAGWSN